MNEIGMFTALRPEPPASTATMREAVRDRLTIAINGSRAPAPAPARRWALSRARVAAFGGLVAAGTAAAIVVPAVLPGGASGTFVTKAWAVERASDGTVTFSIGKVFNDPQGLQRALRADGVAAFVRVNSMKVVDAKSGSKVYSPGCNYQGLQAEPENIQQAVLTPPAREGKMNASWTVHPAAMPGESSLLIAIWPSDIGIIALRPVVLSTSQPPVCVPGPPN